MATENGGSVDKKQKQGSGDASTATDLTCEAETYGASFVDKLSKARESDYMCNYTIRVEGKEIRAHALVLATNSHLFKTMFKSGFADGSKDEVDLKDRTYIGVKAVIDHMYSGKIEMNTNTLPEILDAASYLQVQSALDLCEQAIKDKMITVESWQDAMSLAEMYNLKSTEDGALFFLAVNFQEFYDKLNITPFRVHNIENILLSLHSRATEVQLFSLCERWVLHNYAERKRHVASLVKAINFHFMDKEEIAKCLSSEMFETHEDGQAIVQNICEFISKSEKKSLQLLLDRKYNRPRGKHSLMLFVSQPSEASEAEAMEEVKDIHVILSGSFYKWNDMREKQASLIREGKTMVAGAGICCHDNFVFVCGGKDESAETFVYNPVFDSWAQMANMNSGRTYCDVVGIGDYIYAIGGANSQFFVSEVERYNIADGTNEWQLIGGIDIEPKHHSIPCCAFNGLLFMLVFGETDEDDQPTFYLLCYEPVETGLRFLLKHQMNRLVDGSSHPRMFSTRKGLIFINDGKVLLFNPKTESFVGEDEAYSTSYDYIVAHGDMIIYGKMDDQSNDSDISLHGCSTARLDTIRLKRQYIDVIDVMNYACEMDPAYYHGELAADAIAPNYSETLPHAFESLQMCFVRVPRS